MALPRNLVGPDTFSWQGATKFRAPRLISSTVFVPVSLVASNCRLGSAINSAYVKQGQTLTTFTVPSSVIGTTNAFGINDAGEIVGSFVGLSQAIAFSHGYLKNGSEFTQVDFPAALATLAFKINNVGNIAGTFFAHDAQGGVVQHGFITDAVAFTAFDPPNAIPSLHSLCITGLNDFGQVVGNFSDQLGFGGGIKGFLNHGNSFHVFESGLYITGIK